MFNVSKQNIIFTYNSYFKRLHHDSGLTRNKLKSLLQTFFLGQGEEVKNNFIPD